MAILPIVNDAAMHRGAQTSVLVLFSALCIISTEVELLDRVAQCKLNFELPYCFCFVVLFSAPAVCGNLVPPAGIEPVTLAVEAQSLNGKTAREVPAHAVFSHPLWSSDFKWVEDVSIPLKNEELRQLHPLTQLGFYPGRSMPAQRLPTSALLSTTSIFHT